MLLSDIYFEKEGIRIKIGKHFKVLFRNYQHQSKWCSVTAFTYVYHIYYLVCILLKLRKNTSKNAQNPYFFVSKTPKVSTYIYQNFPGIPAKKFPGPRD